MGRPTGFKEYSRRTPMTLSPEERVANNREFTIPLPVGALREQGARCMDCGVPFCIAGCPVGNVIPDWNDLVYRGDWEKAITALHATNNFPEFTGRICPAPCEEACVLGITKPPVTIKTIELAIVERAFEEGWIKPRPPQQRTGKRVAVVGSGPAGLACADQLNRAGHRVTVFERADRIGGLLRYGVPDFKLEKWIIDRRVELLTAEGISFLAGMNVGFDVTADELRPDFDAIVLSGGATQPRDLPVPGRELDGIHLAMEFLPQQTKRVAGDDLPYRAQGWWFDDDQRELSAAGKHVIVIGGGDTGSDCVGTSNRQGAASVTQFELLDRPPDDRPRHQPWPYWPMKLRTSSSHEEGCARHWSVMTKRFGGADGRVTELHTVQIEWTPSANGDRPQMREIPGSEKSWPADLVLLAMGFVGPEPDGIVAQLAVELDERGSVKTDRDYGTSEADVFCCGDMRRGQSLIVWAISEGREAAHAVDVHLMGSSFLPRKGQGDLPVV